MESCLYFQHCSNLLHRVCIYFICILMHCFQPAAATWFTHKNCFYPSQIITLDTCLHVTYAVLRVNGAAWKWCDPSETVTSALLPFSIKHTLRVFWRKLSFELCYIHLALRLSNLQTQSAVNTWVLVGCPWWKSSAVRNIKMYTHNKLL